MKELFNIQQRLVSNKVNFNEFSKFNYRNLEGILADVKPLLNEYKCTITFTDDMVLIGERYYVKSTVTLTNENNEKFSAVAFAREDLSRAGMSESQVTGTASSYARKYAICSLLAINEEQDPDSMDNRSKSSIKAQTTPSTPITNNLPYNVHKDRTDDELSWRPDDTCKPITPNKDNLTRLTEFCAEKKTDATVDKTQLTKFYNYYKDRANTWRGDFNIINLYAKWTA